MVDVSPMILASALANLSPLGWPQGVIGLESWPKLILQGRGSWLDSGKSDRWRPADRHCRFASSDNGGAGDELVLKMTARVDQSWPSALE